MKGTVFNIQRFSLHDGPGIRTTVFMKGCNLRCFWCHNPEGLSVRPQLLRYPDKCVGCGRCAAVCERGLDAAACVGCLRCAAVCPAGARVTAGEEKSDEEVAGLVLRDAVFYGRDGGVTFSGGEPLLQAAFVAACMERLAASGVSGAVETAGCVPWESFERVLAAEPLVILDVKHHNAAAFARCTGGRLELVLENLRRLSLRGARFWVRIPVIPGVNDREACVSAIGAAIAAACRGGALPEKVELMPFHALGGGKYAALGAAYQADGLEPPPAALIERCKAALTAQGFSAC